jgi:Photosynthetic reaction centre cytochrome C subunit
MSRHFSSSLFVLCGFGILAFALAAQPPAPPAAQGAAGAQPRGPQNLKVLPENTDLRAVMHQYETDLGVNCEFCHTGPDPLTHRPDRASDANPTKEVARYMIQMTDDLNSKYLDQMPNRRYADPVTCGTCHRGEKHPSIFAPTPRPDAMRPTGAQPAGPPAK